MSNNDLWDDIADEVIDYVEERGRGRNQLRQAYLDSLSENGWRSREFEGLITTFVDAYRDIEDHFARPRDRGDDTMKRAIPEMIDGHFAKSVLQDRRLSDELDDDTYEEMKKAAEVFDRLVGRSSRGRGRGRDDRDDRDDRRGRGRDDRRGRGRDDRDSDRGGRYDDRRTSASNLGRERRHDDRDERQPRRTERETVNADPWDMLKTVREFASGPGEEVRETRRETARPQRTVEERVEEKKPEPAVVENRHPGNGPDYTQAKPHLEFWKNNEHWMAFHICKWKLTERNSEPLTAVPSLYNVKTHIKYYVMNDRNEVREEHIPVNEENRYVAHELLDNPTDGGRASSAIDLRGLGKKAVEVEEYADIGDDDEDETDRLATTICCVRSADLSEFTPVQIDSMESIVFAANAKAIVNGVDAANQYAVKRTPILISDYGQLDLVVQISQCVSLTDAAVKMRELKSRFEPAVFNELNNRFTQLLMRAMRYQFQFNAVTAMSFASDWEKALAYIATKRGNEFAAGLASRLAPIVRFATLHVEKDGVQATVGDLYDGVKTEGDTEVETEVPAVVFLDFVSMIALRDNSDLLGLGQQFDKMADGASVTTTSNRLLSDALRAIYRKATANASAIGMRVYMSTKDGRVIEVFPYAARNENFILAKV